MPARARYAAQIRPLWPAPTTTTSASTASTMPKLLPCQRTATIVFTAARGEIGRSDA